MGETHTENSSQAHDGRSVTSCKARDASADLESAVIFALGCFWRARGGGAAGRCRPLLGTSLPLAANPAPSHTDSPRQLTRSPAHPLTHPFTHSRTGGHHFPYPKWVWSPSGGWWPKPTNWKRNTAAYAVVMGCAALWLYQNAEAKTVAYYPKEPPKTEAGDSHH